MRLRRRVRSSLGVGGKDKDAHRLGHNFAHLRCALHVDIEQQVMAGVRASSSDCLRRAVKVAEDFGVTPEKRLRRSCARTLRGW